MYRLYVFDLDGTLIDSRRDLAESMNALLESCGGSALPEAAVGRMVGDGAAMLVARAFEAARMERPPDALGRFLKIYDARLLTYTRPYFQMEEVLASLARRADLGVLTNKPLGATRSILAGLGLIRFFDAEAVVGGDGPFPRKPDPRGLQHLMARAAVGPAATLFVGDSAVDWRTARNASVAICLARYGFGFDGLRAGEVAAAAHLIDTPADLLAL